MAKYNATIFNFGMPLHGMYYNTHSVECAIERFNNTRNIVTLEDELPSYMVSLDRAAGTAKLEIDKDVVTATIELIDTSCGRLVEELITHNLLVAMPITMGSVIGNVIQVVDITKLALLNRDHVQKQTELARMKDWVNNDLIIYNLYNIRMYDITEIKDK